MRKELKSFAERMEQELKLNDYKGGWQVEEIHTLLYRLRQETSELEAAIANKKTPKEIAGECADVANFCMMIADNMRGL